MATRRKKLIKKFSTRGKRGQSYLAERATIIHALLSGERVSTLADRFNCHRKTITNTLKRYRTMNSLDTRPRIGSPPKLSMREKSAFYRQLWQNPEMPHAQLQTWVESYTSYALVACQNGVAKRAEAPASSGLTFPLHFRHEPNLKQIINHPSCFRQAAVFASST